MIRTAQYSTMQRDEVRLRYPFPGNGPDAGKPFEVYYTADEYAGRQSRYGKAMYPDPQPDTAA